MMKIIKSYILICLSFIYVGCVEEIAIATETEAAFESILVVQAIITNELKQQDIVLSRSYFLEEEPPVPENNATVRVLSSDGGNYLFQGSNAGTYTSTIPFAAQIGIDYNLEIITNNGETYTSESVQLTQPTPIDSLYVARDFNENDDEGVSIYINSFDPTTNSKYYRFQYQEAYKIIAPVWTNVDVDFGTPPDEPQFILVPRPVEEQVCYNVVDSNEIIITSTVDLDEDRLDQFRIRFISRDNYIMSHRYTIEVKQYVQSFEAYNYYKTLRDFTNSEGILSETQVGFIEGNINALNSSNEKVIGFFEASSVDTKRVYFNYEDLFPDEVLPPYVRDCELIVKPATFNPSKVGPRCPLCGFIEDGNWKYLADNPDFDPADPNEGPYLLVARECGDCTPLGNSNPPEFWEE